MIKYELDISFLSPQKFTVTKLDNWAFSLYSVFVAQLTRITILTEAWSRKLMHTWIRKMEMPQNKGRKPNIGTTYTLLQHEEIRSTGESNWTRLDFVGNDALAGRTSFVCKQTSHCIYSFDTHNNQLSKYIFFANFIIYLYVISLLVHFLV